MVDDSVVVRRMLSDALSADPQLEVVGAAANGKIALARIPQVNPDIVILDVEMPELDGLETLRRLRQTHPFLPVIMFSTLTQRGAAATLDALSLGANDYVTKPANVGSAHQAIEQIRAELIPKIKMFCARAAGLESHVSDTLRSADSPRRQTLGRAVPPLLEESRSSPSAFPPAAPMP